MKKHGDNGYYKGNSPLIERFIHAFHGIQFTWDKEPNFRIQVLSALVVLAAMVILPISPIERAILAIVIAFVLTLEAINSIFERVLDVVHPRFSEEIKRIKDTMAGVVLIGSVTAVTVGALILTRPLLTFDVIFQESLADFRSSGLIDFARLVTSLGDWPVFVALVAVSSMFLLYQKRYMFFSFLLGLTVGGELFVFLTKYVLGRDRPSSVGILEIGGYSFPSGHVFLATVFWIAIAFIFTYGNKERRYLWLLPGILIPLIALSRVVLSVHWFSDIVAGFLFGIFWLLIWYGINKRLFERFKNYK